MVIAWIAILNHFTKYKNTNTARINLLEETIWYFFEWVYKVLDPDDVGRVRKRKWQLEDYAESFINILQHEHLYRDRNMEISFLHFS